MMASHLNSSLIAFIVSASIASGARAQSLPDEKKDVVPAQPATSAPITLDLSLRMTDKYTPGRGYVLSNESAIQPYAMLNIPVPEIGGTFSAGYAGSMSTGKQDYQEHDRLLSYTRDICDTPWGTLTGTVGHMTFTDATMPGETRFSEVQARVKLQHEINPTIFFAHDYGAGNGQYAEFSVTKRTELPVGERSVPFDATLKAHYNNHYVVPGTGFAGMTVSAAVPIITRDGMSIAADVSYFQTWQPERFKSHGNVGITMSTSVPILK